MSEHEHLPLIEVLRNTLCAVEAQGDPMTPEKAKLLRYLRERIAVNDTPTSASEAPPHPAPSPHSLPVHSAPSSTATASRDRSHSRSRCAVEQSISVPKLNPPCPEPPPALYELRHLRRALSRLESTHATTSPVIANLKRQVVNRICELEAELGSTELVDALTTLRNT